MPSSASASRSGRLISTMMIDFLSNPRLDEHDLSSLQRLRGGGAAMPAAIVAQAASELTGLDYVEGYGMSETLAATHINPAASAEAAMPGHPGIRRRCRGSSIRTRCTRLADGETGEIVVSGAAGDARLLEQRRRPTPTPSSRSTAGASCAPAISAASTRTAISSWSTA